ncbi:hypothetical protein AAHE18_06G150000 [Arachis hypogaea]
MLGLDPNLVTHNLAVRKGATPVKQAPRKFSNKVEVQPNSSNQYKPSWLANIVLVKKKNRQIQCCVNFRDLNKACPMDDFSLPDVDRMVYATAEFERFSFMDGFSGYNQIRMALGDEEKIAFRTPVGNFYYTVMPFGLKNAGSTYQRAMTAIFHDIMHDFVEDYVEDLVVKSTSEKQHTEHLRVVFTRYRKYRLKMNPMKCAFRVSSGKFLGFKVHKGGISADEDKIKVVQDIKPPKDIKKLQKFIGKLGYIQRFIPTLRELLEPLRPLLKEKNTFKTMKGPEQRYSSSEKNYLALVYISQRYRHYFQAHQVEVVSKNEGLRSLIEKPTLTGRIGCWALLLCKYDVKLVTSTTIKNQALADLLLISPKKVTIKKLSESHRRNLSFMFRLSFSCTNNEAKYEALMLGIKMAQEIGIKKFHVKGDYSLIIQQIHRVYGMKETSLALYREQVWCMMKVFNKISFEYVPRTKNKHVDSLATLGSRYLDDGVLPSEKIEAERLKKKSERYFLQKGELFKKIFAGEVLKCVRDEEKDKILEEVHQGVCGRNQGGRSLWYKLIRIGYYWPKMKKDAINWARRCPQCQKHANLIHASSVQKNSLKTSHPLHTWVIDFVGPINPQLMGKKLILVAIESFTKWVEAVAIREANAEAVVRFIKENIICRFGLPSVLVSDNGTHFYQIKHHKSSPTTPQGNGQAEAINKSILKILTKVVINAHKIWSEYLPLALWAYKTTRHGTIEVTPFSLVYRVEAVLPAEIEVPIARMLLDEARDSEVELQELEEKREVVGSKMEEYHRRLALAYDKHVWPRVFLEGELVLKSVDIVIRKMSVLKWAPKWEGPYIVSEVHPNEHYILLDPDHGTTTGSINFKYVKKYYT